MWRRWFSEPATKRNACTPHRPRVFSRTCSAPSKRCTFKTVRGQVTIVGAGDARRAAVVGGPLFPGERLLTGPDSVVALTLRDGTILTMDKESSLDLAAFDFNSTTHEGNLWVRVMRGTLRVVSGLIAKVQPENVRVTTPTAVIGVRGTDFIVEAN